jgi:hypothetical protein
MRFSLLLTLATALLLLACEELLNQTEELAPNPPRQLVVQLSSTGAIEFSWLDDSDNENGFILEYQVSGSIVWNVIAEIGSNVTSYSWSGAQENTTYNFRILAFNDTDNSDYAFSPELTVPFKAPNDLTATSGQSGIALEWQDNSSVESGYEIARRTLTSGWSTIASLEPNSTSHLDANPLYDQQVQYVVRGIVDGVVVGESNLADVTVPPLLETPSGLTATFSDGVITVSWTDNSHNEDGFIVERLTSNSNGFWEIARLASNTTTYEDTEFPYDETISYRVLAYLGMEYSEPSNTDDVFVPVDLSAPSNLTAILTGSFVELSWDDNSAGEEGFIIERDIDGNGYTEINRVATMTTYTDGSAPENASIAYTVYAYYGTARSGPSNEAVINTGGGVNEVYYEGFESYEPGTFPLPSWSLATNHPDYVYAFVDFWDELEKSLWFADDSLESYGWLNLDFPDVGDGSFEAFLGLDNSYNGDGYGLMLGFDRPIQAAEDIAVRIEFTSDGVNNQMYLHDGNDWVAYPFPPNEWFHLQIIWRMNSGYQVYLNQSQVGGTLPFYNGNSGTTMSGMSILMFDNWYLYWGLIDEIHVTSGVPANAARGPVYRSEGYRVPEKDVRMKKRLSTSIPFVNPSSGTRR